MPERTPLSSVTPAGNVPITLNVYGLTPPVALIADTYATFDTAEICGTPTPATIRVVQMEPGPIPTLMPSTPAFTRSRARFSGRNVAADDLQLGVSET